MVLVAVEELRAENLAHSSHEALAHEQWRFCGHQWGLRAYLDRRVVDGQEDEGGHLSAVVWLARLALLP